MLLPAILILLVAIGRMKGKIADTFRFFAVGMLGVILHCLHGDVCDIFNIDYPYKGWVGTTLHFLASLAFLVGSYKLYKTLKELETK